MRCRIIIRKNGRYSVIRVLSISCLTVIPSWQLSNVGAFNHLHGAVWILSGFRPDTDDKRRNGAICLSRNGVNACRRLWANREYHLRECLQLGVLSAAQRRVPHASYHGEMR